MSPEENLRTYGRFVADVLNKRSIDLAEQYFAPQFVDHSLASMGIQGTVEGFKEWFRMFYAAFPDATWKIEYMDSKGDWVYHHKIVKGTHKGEYLGVPATGKEIRSQETGLVRFKDGKMVEFWGTFDDFGIARQLGRV
ncbi:ester cyclase [Mesorhizobium sp. CC13]|uniref:ester cyclase n=1 Tax=Mesorhizobium sp. CC13 TaxID=3029194 RepID=UPI003262F96C